MPVPMVPTIMDDLADFTVIATSPKEMEHAQKSLILWAARKIQAVKVDLDEAQKELEIAASKKWGTAAWRNQIRKHQNTADFYRKIKAALEAGYYIVPPFPVDVFAIRVNRTAPVPMRRIGEGYDDSFDQKAQALALGSGHYVDPRPQKSSHSYHDGKNHDGTPKLVTDYWATEYNEVGFPFKLAKAEIREATDKALASGIFDRLGVLPRVRAPDPIVCGQIIVPHQPGYYSEDNKKIVNFFVAWWLDTKTL